MYLIIVLHSLFFALVSTQGFKIQEGEKYLLLATKKTSTMQKELEEAASRGFRIAVGSPTSGSEMALILERAAQPPDIYAYKLLATTRTGTMQKELNEAAEGGFRLLPRTFSTGYFAAFTVSLWRTASSRSTPRTSARRTR